MHDQIGRVLDGRYRLIAPIGTGASGRVYLADDVRLRRRVAVKILHESLADDEGFLKRFQAEAHAAAALNHPHVMAVYDWGRDELPYLVTEYLGGGSLRGLLDQGHRLSLSQALLVGLEATRGLDYAHRRGFVHRDIKPANLLFGDDGRLRIADFGLARALAEAAWTEPSGAVLGTARYASPEQAQGRSVDGKADVYALGLTLVEAVSGSVPFAADTTIATLMARIDTPVELDDSFGRLRSVLERAGRPDPVDRPDAGELAVFLMAAAEDLPRPEPLPLAGAVEGEPDDAPPADLTRIAGTVAAAGATGVADPGAPNGSSGPPPFDAEAEGGVGATAGPDQADVPTTVVPSIGPEPADDDLAEPAYRSERARRRAEKREAKEQAKDERERRRDAGSGPRRRRWPWAVAAVALLAALGGGGAYAWLALTETPTFEVESFVGLQADEVPPLVAEYGWTVTELQNRQDGTEPGEVIAQEPEAGTLLEEGAELTITVSLGNTLVEVPTGLEGLTLDEATARIADAELEVGTVTSEFSEEVPAGSVIGVPTTGPLPKGEAVDLLVSDGPEPRTVPTLDGATFADATAELEALGLVAEEASEPSETVDEGLVVRTEPAAGEQVERGATVRVVVSSGLPFVEVPDVAGLSAGEAANLLEGAGFTIADTVGPPNRPVLVTDPPAGESHRKGTAVTIITRST
jgi:serine/threonine-protein kinase